MLQLIFFKRALKACFSQQIDLASGKKLERVLPLVVLLKLNFCYQDSKFLSSYISMLSEKQLVKQLIWDFTNTFTSDQKIFLSSIKLQNSFFFHSFFLLAVFFCLCLVASYFMTVYIGQLEADEAEV